MDKEKLQRGLGLFLDAMRPYVVSVVEPYSPRDCQTCPRDWIMLFFVSYSHN